MSCERKFEHLAMKVYMHEIFSSAAVGKIFFGRFLALTFLSQEAEIFFQSLY